MGPREVLATVAFWMVAATEALADGRGRGDGHGHGAPEIDGPAGIAALVLLVSAGLLAYNRLKK